MRTSQFKKIFFISILAVVVVGIGWFCWPQVSALAAGPDLGLAPVGDASGLSTTDVRVVAARIIRTFLGLLGIIALVLILFAGFRWMTAGGNEEKVEEAKKILQNAVIGLVIIISSYAITSFVISKLVGATTGTLEHCSNNVQDAGETGLDCGGDCNACGGGGGGGVGGGFSNGNGTLTVAALPGSGPLCVRNPHLAIVFSQPVEMNTLTGNVVVTLKDGVEPVAGTWERGDSPTTVLFVPAGQCGAGSIADCLQPNTAYRLSFVNPSNIKSIAGSLPLNCAAKPCGPVDFVTGEGIDRQPPTITFVSPLPNSSIQSGATVPIKVSYVDDNGVQNVSLYQGSTLIDSQSINGCQKTGTVDLNWVTGNLSVGSYEVVGQALDWSGGNGRALLNLSVKPDHCFNQALEKELGEKVAGPPACGGECGICAGETCSSNAECSSGYCDIGSDGKGACVERVRLDQVSPRSGAPGTYVTLNGAFLGSAPGHVYFASVLNPDVKKPDDWIEAKTVSCGAGFNPWSTTQVVVEVPLNAKNGPVVLTAGNVTIATLAGAAPTAYDSTNNDWGPRIGDFGITNEVRPGLCGITPQHGFAGTKVQLIGKNLGLLDNANDQVWFGSLKAVTTPGDWLDAFIKTTVPNLDGGDVGVKVIANSFESNSIKFTVDAGTSEDSPLISAVTPLQGARGEYITITGANFGTNLGSVWFKQTPESEAINGDFVFPPACQNFLWRNDQVVVKFPVGKGEIGSSYFIQIKTADNKVSPINSNWKFSLVGGNPSPGVCGLTPVSGPVPFPPGEGIKVVGEYFGSAPSVYFWSAAAKPNDVAGRALADQKEYTEVSDKNLTVRPPAATITGPVVVARSEDKKISNPGSFSVLDCTKSNNTCPLPGYTCCSAGIESGICKPSGELCQGSTRSTGYAWRFSTQAVGATAPEALAVPHVVERCDAATDLGKNLPSPSPSVQWDLGPNDDHHNICRTALSVVEFSLPLDQKTVNDKTVLIQKCSQIDTNKCLDPVVVPLTPESFLLRTASRDEAEGTHQYLQLLPEVRSWQDDSWYRVILTNQIKSVSEQGVSSSLPLAADKPCDVASSAYCFNFKTGSQNCLLKAVVVTPYSYWTKVLEAPIKYHGATGSTSDVYYYGNGVSSQHCTLMDVSGLDWSWSTTDSNYSEIYGPSKNISTQVTAKANTVAIGLKNPDDAVNIVAEVITGSRSYKGVSPLMVDLSDPEVVDYWPNCQEACLNSEVGVKFNTSMSWRNLPGAISGGSVQLLKCNDENCRSTKAVLALGDVKLDAVSGYTVLKIANSGINSLPLEANSLYQVIVSTSSTNPNVPNQLWSAARLGDPSSFSKPYKKEFTWRFRTKQEKCKISQVTVEPDVFYSQSVSQKTIYGAQPYSSPDSCSAKGQALNPWSVSWNWSSNNQSVAKVTMFNTLGSNTACTASCLRRGSDIPASQLKVVPICGNGIVEAGEDCDAPNKNGGCSLNCLFTGNTAPTCGNGIVEPNLGEACDPKDSNTAEGCSQDCRHSGSNQEVKGTEVKASICGNGLIGDGEDCDLGINSSISDPKSKLNCSASCTHQGSLPSAKWCFENSLTHGGFSTAEFEAVCAGVHSQCGDGVLDPSEDADCDDPVKGWNSLLCNESCLKKSDSICTPGTEGCDENGRLAGSSLFYSQPSYCGDGVTGIGEISFCESGLQGNHQGLFDPWSLVSGVGLGVPTGNPPSQVATINASTAQATKGGTIGGSGDFVIACGYEKDADCKAVFGDDYGVGQNSCCYAKPRLLNTYPQNGSATVCPNTYLEAVFDRQINSATLTNETLLIARSSTICSATETDVTDLVVATRVSGSSEIAWYNQLWHRVTALLQRVFSFNAAQAADMNAKWCIGGQKATAKVLPGTDGTSRVVVTMSAPLAFNSNYAVILKEGVKDINGVSIGQVKGKNIQWNFSTTDKICEINSVKIDPPQHFFSVAGATTTLEATAFTSTGAKVQPIVEYYDWEYAWGPTDNPFVSLLNTTSSLEIVTAANRSGELDVRSTAKIKTNKYTNTSGAVATGNSHVIVFLCSNPWPPKAAYYNGQGPFSIFPYEDKTNNNDGFNGVAGVFDNTSLPPTPLIKDGYFNFSTYYCADNGAPGTSDDLPFLRPAVQLPDPNKPAAATPFLKRFLFTSNQNSDAIGLQIFANPNHLSVQEWYSQDKAKGGQGFVGQVQPITLSGYEAITDGNNIYIDALNYSDVTKNLYSNIYLFSINANAQEGTRKVFEQLVKNFAFNTNITNYHYCGLDQSNPGFETACTSDLDCPNTEVCSATVDKLKRNYQRLRDLGQFQKGLDGYALARTNRSLYPTIEEYKLALAKNYPSLQEGTYLTGQSLSVWPSWSLLSTAIGSSAPEDPINQLGVGGTCAASVNRFCRDNADCSNGEACVLHDAQTAWSIADRRFSFACASTSLSYRYIYSASTGYTVRGNLEKTDLVISNQAALTGDFVSSTHFILNSPTGICNQDQEISTLNQGVCGDGVVNSVRGEQCDPPGATRYGACSETVADKIQISTCTNKCQWELARTVECSYLSKCGNGIVENGEKCDDGRLNGKYNHCAADCKGFGTAAGFCGDGKFDKANEICEIKDGLVAKAGVCAGGALAGTGCNTKADCNTVNNQLVSLGGICNLGVDVLKTGRYNKAKQLSCGVTCLETGPYCGDGIVQAQFGEECDGAQSCTINGRKGARACSSNCKLFDKQAYLWWSFEEAAVDSGEATFLDSSGKNKLTCTVAGGCPEVIDGKNGHAVKFTGVTSVLKAKSIPALDLDKQNFFGGTSQITIAAWVKPVPDDPVQNGWKNVLTKLRTASDYADKPTEKAYAFLYSLDSSKINKLAFTAFFSGSLGTRAVALENPISGNEWHHIAVVEGYDQGSYVATFYVDGKVVGYDSFAGQSDNLLSVSEDALDTGIYNNNGKAYTNNAYPIAVGQQGGLDDLRVYNRFLNGSEIQNLVGENWACVSTDQSLASIAPAGCGDGKVDNGEACDRGVNNGVKCTPGYGQTCNYCSFDCKNVIEVQPPIYCGDGVVQPAPLGAERCDVDVSTGIVYASQSSAYSDKNFDATHQGYPLLACAELDQEDYTFKKELSRQCLNKCSLPQTSCLKCGYDEVSGVAVQGAIINVLDPANSNPLLAKSGQDGKLDIAIIPQSAVGKIPEKRLVAHAYWAGTSKQSYSLKAPMESGYDATTLARINSNSLCSTGDPSYKLIINDDTTHAFPFPVFAKPAVAQYDLTLSPVINEAVRPNDIRIVVSWLSAVDLNSGFLVPVAGKGKIESGTLKPFVATGPTYAAKPALDGIWYHDFGSTANSMAIESFTVNTTSSLVGAPGMVNDQYVFYVRVNGTAALSNGGIKKASKDGRLKVEVYLPESDSASNHFARPTYTFYGTNGIPTQNPNTTYWQVFSLKRAVSGDKPADRIVPINKFITEQNFK